MNRWLRGGLILIALAAILTLAGRFALTHAMSVPLQISQPEEVLLVERGTTLTSLTEELKRRGILPHPLAFKLTARLRGAATRLQAGEYALDADMSSADLLDALVSGNVVMRSFTIIEGWTVRELLDALQKEDALASLPDDLDAATLMFHLYGEAEHAEGQFLPETYHYSLGTEAADVLRRAHNDLEAAVADAWDGRDGDLPFDSPYEALTLASIVEKETGAADERAMIAGVFVRRLQERMRLETDPTVIYGLGEAFNGNLTRRHLETDTPYNTYTRRGLPPTPIALAGTAAIDAAMHPTPGTAMFFVASGDGDGRHVFSDSYEEHRAAVQEYLRKLRNQRNKP